MTSMSDQEIKDYILKGLGSGLSRAEISKTLKEISGPDHQYSDFELMVHQYPDATDKIRFSKLNRILAVIVFVFGLYVLAIYGLSISNPPISWGLWVIMQPLVGIGLCYYSLILRHYHHSSYLLILCMTVLFLDIILKGPNPDSGTVGLIIYSGFFVMIAMISSLTYYLKKKLFPNLTLLGKLKSKT